QDKNEAIQEKNLKEYVRGPIIDRNGETLASSEEPLGKRTYTKPKAFSSLLGYWSSIYSTAGLEKTLDSELSVSECPRKGEKVGSTVQLTIDSGLQTKAYQAISDYKGAAVVLNAKTGEILALTSSPSFNGNKIEEDWETLNQTEGIFTSNAFQNSAIPGSVFKLVTSAAILENGLEDEVVEDKGSLWVDGREIQNSDGSAYGELTFEEGFVNSSNVYFMTQGLKLGADVLEQTMKKFLIGETISLDFTDLKSNLDFGDYSDNMVATTAFGQGNTLITPLHMAMIAQSIAGDGQMMKPYVIASVTNGKGETVTEGKKEVLTETVTKETAQKIKNAMVKAGEKYEMSTLSDGGQIAAKTGTAQRGDGTNNAWMVSFAPAEDPEYVVCLNHLGTDEYGISLKEEMEGIYDYLFSSEE
ncbi:MAG: penicillin-binding transpeptidase domain-containing protein, partial [Lachnospiraceae bacterium]|nr:penicillin-binding transpeptidase domain-containing protein [Lachnospiraceae bacterium]